MHRFLAGSLMASSARWLMLAGLLRPSPICQFKISPLPQVVSRKYHCRSLRVTRGASKATRREKLAVRLDEQNHSHILWWKEKMEVCKKPSTVHLINRLNYTNLLGLDVSLKNGSLKDGSLNSEILQFKSKFHREVLLCRVGDFYEALGFDACILVEYAGLNPFGGLRSDSIPRAGCPVVNLRQTLDDLTRAGFSVCIVEEVQGPAQARSRKGRFISGHAHPGSPYVFGLAGADHDVDFPEPMPVVGISHSVKGYCLISVIETMKTYSLEDGLTEEAVVTKLRTCRCHHLFLHASLRHNSSGTSRWGEFGEGGLLWSECNGRPFEWFDGIPLEELLYKVKEIYGLDEETTFRSVTTYPEKRPQPLYLGTASQIGVIPTEGIPSLLKVLVPSDCTRLPVLYLRDLLLNPPSYAVAASIQYACRIMSSLTCSIPEFTCMSSAKLVRLLESREANHIEFCRMKSVVDDILLMHSNPELSPILHVLLEPSWVATGLNVEYEMLIAECECISQRIDEIISVSGDREQDVSSTEFIPREFFEDIESSWKGRVKRIHAEEVFAEVDRAAQSLSAAVLEDFVPIVSRVKSVMSSLGGPRGEICYAREHEAVWFKGKCFMPSVWANTPGEAQIKQLRPAIDAKGRKVGEEWFTTDKVENAITRYQEANEKAKVKVLDLLQGLSSELQAKVNILVFSSMLLVIAKSLSCHVSEARRREWVFPNLQKFEKSEDKLSSQVAETLELTGLSPYWFDVAQGKAIQNTIKMQSMFLLTGPNGGGKSSLLRAVCAAALLGICGLMVPAASAIVPHFDSVMLHMKAYDSPADGKSSFQIEMSEIRSLVSGATSRSLVLVDEICRGTETAKGTCIAGSIIETLDQQGCMGIVSTHLHEIFDLPLATKNIVHKAMGTETIDGHVRPTWKLIDGVCKESLAFETALREGIPETIVRRAEELYLSLNAQVTQAECLDHNSHLKCTAEDSCPLRTQITSTSENMQVFLKEVESAVTVICQRKLVELYKNKNIPELVEVTCVPVGVREQPPPSTVGASSIYVLFRPDKKLYVGQTDDLLGRIRAHRSKEGWKTSSFLYVIVPGKSIASQLETLLINQLPLQGFRLTNKADGKHRNFGTTSTLALETLSLHQ